jgi:hypothetical protein
MEIIAMHDLNQFAAILRQQGASISEIADALRQHKVALERLESQGRKVDALGDSAVRDSSDIRRKFDSIESEIKKLTRSIESTPTAKVNTIDDVPGYRIPRWYSVQVDLEEGSTARTSGNVTIDPEGPFVITQIVPGFLITDAPSGTASFIGRNVPCSASAIIYNQLGSSGTITDVSGPINAVIPELVFELEIGGSGRLWTNQPVSAAAFYGFPQPLITGVAGWIDPTDTFKVYATPIKAMPVTGTVEFVMHGYQILNPNIRLSKFLGFAN